jgi:hypothetical protein
LPEGTIAWMRREFSAGLRSPVKVRPGSVLSLCFG